MAGKKDQACSRLVILHLPEGIRLFYMEKKLFLVAIEAFLYKTGLLLCTTGNSADKISEYSSARD